MNEIEIRKAHRYLGIALAFFLLLQGGSGTLISIGMLFEPHGHSEVSEIHSGGEHGEDAGHNLLAGVADERHDILGQIHHKGGRIWIIYRILLGTGLLALLFTGILIFIKIQARERRAAKE